MPWKSSHTRLPESKNKRKIGATLFYILFFYKCIFVYLFPDCGYDNLWAMNVYRFYFSTASDSPTLVPFFCDLQYEEGVFALLASDWRRPPKCPPWRGKQVLIGRPEYPVLS